MSDPIWEAYAVRYAVDAERRAFQCFLGGAGGDGPMPFAYHAFLLRGPGGWVAMDTGADAETCARRGKAFTRGLAEAMGVLGIAPDSVAHVVQTHLHWDHAGGTALFPRATFHLQARELAYATGPAMRHAMLRGGYDVAHLAEMLELQHAGRLALHDGMVALLPGLTLHHVGGHSDGLQLAALATRSGPLCLATDAVTHRANLAQRIPFPVLFHAGDALDAFDTVLRLAGTPERAIPAHDPWVIDAHPPAAAGTAGWISRLD